MADQFIAEIRIMAFNYAPKSWATCDGQSLPIQQNAALFSLVGTAFGGDGVTTFKLPDLRGRTPINMTTTGSGPNFQRGQIGGEPTHTLQIAEMPSHSHAAMASPTQGDQSIAAGNYLGPANGLYGTPGNATTLVANEISTVGGQAHENMQPYLTLNFSIALTGLFPSRN